MSSLRSSMCILTLPMFAECSLISLRRFSLGQSQSQSYLLRCARAFVVPQTLNVFLSERPVEERDLSNIDNIGLHEISKITIIH